jgi:sugar lactone lactonase YvrE
MATAMGVAVLLLSCTERNPAYQTPLAGPDAGPEAGESDASGGPMQDAPLADAAASPDLPVADVRPPDAGPDAFVPPAGCGTATVNVGSISNADGVVIDTDGTLYTLTDDARNSYVGRVRLGLAPQVQWLSVDNSPVTWGLALDSARKRIYVLVVSGPGALVAFDNIDGTPAGRTVVTGLSNPNDAVVAADGTVYYTNQGDRHIYAIAASGGPAVRVTRTVLGNASDQLPSALTIDADQNLIVGLEPTGNLYKIVLSGGMEQSRVAYGTWSGWANGLTFDRRGRLYVAIYHDVDPRTVIRLEPNGTTTTIASGGRFSSIAFGRGALDCRDLYITDPYAAMRRVRIDDAL